MKLETQVKEILEWFLYQNRVRRVDTDGGEITVYRIGDNLVRVDIKLTERWEEMEKRVNK